MTYLIFDEQYGIYQAPIFSGYMRAQLMAGRLSVIRLDTMQGMNIDGETWELVPPWPELHALYIVEDSKPPHST